MINGIPEIISILNFAFAAENNNYVGNTTELLISAEYNKKTEADVIVEEGVHTSTQRNGSEFYVGGSGNVSLTRKENHCII